MKTDTHITEKAKTFAAKAHDGQILKNVGKDPFIMHPARVVEIVEGIGGGVEEIAAAWLHDVVEDTKVTIEQIRQEFGDSIADMVDGLTDPPSFEGYPNRIRKKWQADRVVSKSDSVKKIKLADQTVNSRLVGFDPPVGWSPEMRLEYLEGARLIANNCAGICEKLDIVFDDVYKKSAEKIRADMAHKVR
ncbi:MAG: HD domain-containing protein [bacterium]|nr:HD domain-containing protein [bacterium]